MSEVKRREIERSVEEIVESFVEAAIDLPTLEETYYSRKLYNVVRPDGKPTPVEQRGDFRGRFLSAAPATDEQGNLRVEVAKWVR